MSARRGSIAVAEVTVAEHDDLEACAEAILAKLPEAIANFARESARIHARIPLWALVAGHLLYAYENGYLATPVIDPSWIRELPSMQLELGEYTCELESCGRTFTPARWKQRFCSDACGRKAADAARRPTVTQEPVRAMQE